MMTHYKDFAQYKNLLGVLYKLGIHTVDVALQYNNRYYHDKTLFYQSNSWLLHVIDERTICFAEKSAFSCS